MSNDLEKFIRKNREEFDDAAPSVKVWQNVEQSALKKKKSRPFLIKNIYKWSAAAAVFFIAFTSVYFLFIKKYSHETQTAKTETQSNSSFDMINNIAPEYVTEFKETYQSVKDRQKELESIASGEPQLYQQFRKDLNALDSSYTILKNQALQTPNRDIIIKAMIENLQLQAELLNRQLMIFNQFKKQKISKNETSI